MHDHAMASFCGIHLTLEAISVHMERDRCLTEISMAPNEAVDPRPNSYEKTRPPYSQLHVCPPPQLLANC